MFIERIRLPDHIPGAWPFTMAAVRQLAGEGLTFTKPITFLVGENGSGKSTLVEALADVVKINSEGGKAGTRYASTRVETPLGAALEAELTSAGRRLIGGPRLKRRTEWADLEIVDHWRRYLRDPHSYLRHFIGTP